LGEFRYFVDRRILKDPWRDASKQALRAIEAFWVRKATDTSGKQIPGELG